MIKNINNVDINYEVYGNKKGSNIVLLHGWGQNIEMMKPIGDPLSDNNNIIIVDLPGYGLSNEPTYVWTVIDYANAVHSLLQELEIANPIMIGHSFGGKISLMYASLYETQKLILFGSPFKPEITKHSLKTKTLKTLKKVPVLNKLENIAKKYIGSTDYKSATPLMREILVDTINRDITEDVKKITIPTLIIWGSNDDAVPLERAYELERLIKDSAVINYEGCSHYAYLERKPQIIKVIKNFIEEEQ